jgi:hypothetical protein
MGNLQGQVIPSGMLRISKDGDVDRVIYPVHAEGWRQLGWTVHAPVLDEELDEELEDGPVELPDGQGVAPEGAPGGSAPEGAPGGSAPEGALGGSAPEGAPVVTAPQGALGEVINFQNMTRQAIATLVAERTGIEIDPNQSKTAVIAEAEAAIRLAAADEVTPEAAPSNTAPEGAPSSFELDVEVVDSVVDVPNLLI